MTAHRRVVLGAVVAGVALVATGCAEQLGLPESTTEQGDTVGRVFDLYLVAAYVVAAIVVGLIAFILLRFRAGRRSGPASQTHHNAPLEILYTVVPLLLVGALTAVTLVTIGDVAADEPDPDVTIDVEGYQWGWRFTYVDEGITVATDADGGPEVVLPAPARIRFTVHSEDVIHSLWIPAFRFKRDLIPGTTTSFTVDTDELGTFPGKCAEYCGLQHTTMTFTARTVAPDEFEAWKAETEAGTS
ncbi:MAG: cytochrome c oxidase subunit II [Acidimicrobiales bacterium]|nr:cytochrome c oxidase subunit II [Acidimicrobiales bacterium]